MNWRILRQTLSLIVLIGGWSFLFICSTPLRRRLLLQLYYSITIYFLLLLPSPLILINQMNEWRTRRANKLFRANLIGTQSGLATRKINLMCGSLNRTFEWQFSVSAYAKQLPDGLMAECGGRGRLTDDLQGLIK